MHLLEIHVYICEILPTKVFITFDLIYNVFFWTPSDYIFFVTAQLLEFIWDKIYIANRTRLLITTLYNLYTLIETAKKEVRKVVSQNENFSSWDKMIENK